MTELDLKNKSPNDAKPVLGAVRFYSSEAHKVSSEFKKHFGVSFPKFWQGWIIGFDNCILIDIVKFDDYLMNKYNYTGSMSDFVLTKFGKQAHEFLKQLI